MFTPSPLPRTLEASFRDLASEKAATRASAIRDVVRHSLQSDATRARAIPALERALRDDPAPRVLAEAALASADVAAQETLSSLCLARLGNVRGKDRVLDLVGERATTPELEDEQASVELAGEQGWSEAIPHLERRVWGKRRVLRSLLSWGGGDGESCAWHARIALARMGHAKAPPEILADLASGRPETRQAAVRPCGRARLGEARIALENLGGTVRT